MLRTIRKENPELVRTMIALRRASRDHDSPLWGAVARQLARARHLRKPLNVGQLERLAEPKEVIVVPGKLLAAGRLSKALTVAATHYSEGARSKIHAAGGQALTIEELLKARPDGAGVRILA